MTPEEFVAWCLLLWAGLVLLGVGLLALWQARRHSRSTDPSGLAFPVFLGSVLLMIGALWWLR